MNEYRVTFGQRFRQQTHSRFSAAHPDGWLTILASDDDHARAIAVEVLGTEWAFIYAVEEDDVNWSMFPRGELARLDGTEALT